MKKENNLTIIKTKLWTKPLCIILSIIIAFGTLITMIFGSLTLSDYIDLGNLITAHASTTSSDPKFYRYGELVGLYTENYQDDNELQYKIDDDGTWTDYSVPFAIPAHKTTKVYARAGKTGKPTYMLLANTNKALGVYTESNTDFEFTYNNINFEYVRVYNSADATWFESTQSKIVNIDNRIEVQLPDSSLYTMIKKSADLYVDEINGHTLTKTSNNYVFDDGQYKYYFPVEENQAFSYLAVIEDYSGNKLTFNRSGNNVTISDETGRAFVFSCNNDNEIITDANGNNIVYKKENDKYVQVKDQADVIIDEYTYDDDILIKSMDKSISYDNNGRLKQITYDNGTWIKYNYDDVNMTYTTLNSSGKTTKTVYNNAFLPVEYTDEFGTKNEYTYNDHYKLSTEKVDGETFTFAYNSKGNMISYVMKGSDNNVYYAYDSNGNVIREKNGENYTYYTYDDNNNVLIEATLKENYNGSIPTAYDASLTCFDTVSYTYDEKGRVTKEESYDGTIFQYEYDGKGNILKVTSSIVINDITETYVTSYTYDDMGNILSTNSSNAKSINIYDAAGRKLLEKENDNYTRTIYDEYGRIIQEITSEDYDTSKDGLPDANTYSDSAAGHTYNYDENGNLISETNRLGVTTNYKYYSTGEKKQESYDIYEFNYTLTGELESVKVAGKTAISYVHDDYDNLVEEKYANGDTIRYEYNEDGYVTAEYRNNNASPFVTFTYDEENELIQKTNFDSELKYVYGDNNSVDIYRLTDNTLVQSYHEVVTETKEKTEISTKTDISEYHFGTNYSTAIENNSISYTNGENTFSHGYNITDNLNSISDYIKYNDNVISISDYTSDNAGRYIKKSFEDGKVSENKFDGQNRITLTNNNNICDSFEYDNKDQVILYTENENATDYQYDERGNITYKHTFGEDEVYFSYKNDGWKDLLVSVNDKKLTYDANGNVLTYGNKEFKWNSGRHLESIIDGKNVYSYKYAENGIRTSKTVNGVTTYYNTRNGVILSQTDGKNTMYFQYDIDETPIGFIYNNLQVFYRTNQNGDVIALMSDEGNIIATYNYDAWGKVLSIDLPYDDDIYKEIANANPLRYRGYYYDNETGYYYLQSRYYDPSICRFINADNLMFLDGYADTGLNLFAYCCNNPVNYTDPNGYWGEKVHNGYNSSGSTHYNYTFIGTASTAYGTYCWAINRGFTTANAKSLGTYCNDLDKTYPSTTYALALAAASSYTAAQLAEYKKWQYYHFNGKSSGTDTRITYANTQLSSAASKWSSNRSAALKLLGYGLHAKQDIEAHGNMGRGANIPIQKTHADNIDYVWSNSERINVKKDTSEKTRLIATRTSTYSYLDSFISKIGGKSKLK